VKKYVAGAIFGSLCSDEKVNKEHSTISLVLYSYAL
jgi:hypothetical protein